MALAATRRLSTTASSAAAAAAPPKLSMLFRNPKPRPRPDPGVDAPRRGPRPKPREPWEEEAGALLRRLHEGSYLPGPDLSSAPHAVSPDAVKTAAERFGNDHQPVAKWLSGSDLKKVALFGCPTVERRTVFASKRLRAFFNIQEDKTCSSCRLRSSCKFVNQEVPRHNKVILSDTMRVISLFVLDACPQQLQITADLKASVCKLLKDTINLSRNSRGPRLTLQSQYRPLSWTQERYEAVRSHISQLASGTLGFSGVNTEATANVQQSWISIMAHVCLMCRQSRYIRIELPNAV